MTGKPRVEDRTGPGTCWHVTSLCDLEPGVLSEHDFRCEECAEPSRERLGNGKIPAGRRAHATWYGCGSATLDDKLYSSSLLWEATADRPQPGSLCFLYPQEDTAKS